MVLYIPHGSDERFKKVSLSLIWFKLYIPHGSDERSASFTRTLKNLRFISHMVQMKVYLQLQHVLKVVSLYIPHGSDESGC